MIKLLFVDDEKFTRDGIMKSMDWEELGIAMIEQSEDGNYALELAKSFMPDVIVTDIRMPIMNGIDFVTQYREINPHCQVVFISGYSDKEYLKAALRLRAVSYVEKPINTEELRSAIQNAVEHFKKNQEIRINNEKVRMMTPLLKSDLALRLIKKSTASDNLMDIKELEGLQIASDSIFNAIIVRFLPDNASVQKVISEQPFILDTVNLAIQANSYSGLAAFKDDFHLVILLYVSRDKLHLLSNTKLSHLCENIKSCIPFAGIINITIGKKANDILNAYESYNSAALLLHKFFFNDTKEYFFYTDDRGMVYSFNEQTLMNFRETLHSVRKDKLVNLIKSMTSDIRNHGNTLVNNIKDIYFNLLMELYLSASGLGIIFFETGDGKSLLWEEISAIETLSQLEWFLLDFVDKYFIELEAKNKYSSTVLSIISFISSNYYKENLTLKNICEFVKMSQTSICVMFKKETGRTINQYIVEYRVKITKELLKNKQMKISDIAVKVGYNNGNYLANIFKKITNMLPSEYRERL